MCPKGRPVRHVSASAAAPVVSDSDIYAVSKSTGTRVLAVSIATYLPSRGGTVNRSFTRCGSVLFSRCPGFASSSIRARN
jgi:hypothetical protein